MPKGPQTRRGPARLSGAGPLACVLDSADVRCLRALLALRHVELDALVVLEAAIAVGLDRRVVDEYVRLAAIGCDEAEALLAVEPLDRALSHDFLLLNAAGMPPCADPRGLPPGEQPIPASEGRKNHPVTRRWRLRGNRPTA